LFEFRQEKDRRDCGRASQGLVAEKNKKLARNSKTHTPGSRVKDQLLETGLWRDT
jgi:hypothetical protein